jgi:uncharacterized protein YbjT (DUF2867 family)
MQLAITGASGFLGQHLVRHFTTQGHGVRGLTRSREGAARIRAAGGDPAIGDVLRPDTLRPLVAGTDAVIHLVAIIRDYEGATFDQVIRQGTEHVTAAARDAGAQRFLHQSALGAVDDPGYPYLQAKWRGEEAVRRSGLDWTIFRPSILFGEGDHVFTLLAEMARTSPILPLIGRGDMKLQPLWVGDLARIMHRCLEDRATVGRTYDLGGPEHVTYREMLQAAMNASGHHHPVLSIPVGMMKWMARGMEWTMRRPPITYGELMILLRGDNVTERDSVRANFGFDPLPLREGLDYLRRAHAASDVGLGPPPGAGAPPGTPHGREPRTGAV